MLPHVVFERAVHRLHTSPARTSRRRGRRTRTWVLFSASAVLLSATLPANRRRAGGGFVQPLLHRSAQTWRGERGRGAERALLNPLDTILPSPPTLVDYFILPISHLRTCVNPGLGPEYQSLSAYGPRVGGNSYSVCFWKRAVCLVLVLVDEQLHQNAIWPWC